MFFRVVVFILFFNADDALRCFKCNENSKDKCESKQVSEECKPDETSCLTLKFKEDLSTSFFTKTCSKSHDRCLAFCKETLFADTVKDCQVLDCCAGDDCNKKYEKKINRKRSATESHSEPMYKSKTHTLLTILSAIALIYVLT